MFYLLLFKHIFDNSSCTERFTDLDKLNWVMVVWESFFTAPAAAFLPKWSNNDTKIILLKSKSATYSVVLNLNLFFSARNKYGSRWYPFRPIV